MNSIYTWKADSSQTLDQKVKPNMADMDAFWTSVSGLARSYINNA